jgi:hypothetical protein
MRLGCTNVLFCAGDGLTHLMQHYSMVAASTVLIIVTVRRRERSSSSSSNVGVVSHVTVSCRLEQRVFVSLRTLHARVTSADATMLRLLPMLRMLAYLSMVEKAVRLSAHEAAGRCG